MRVDPIRIAHEANDESELEQRVLEALNREIGFDVAFFAALGETPTTIGIDASALVRAFATHAYDDELLPLKHAAFARHGVAVDTDVFGEARVREMRYFRDFARPVGGRHSLMAYLALRGRPIGAVMLGRCGTAFTAGEIDAMATILPALSIARASFRVPWSGEALSSTSTNVLARVGDERRGIVVRDRDGYREMVATEPGAELVWTAARLDRPSRSRWFYIDLFHLAAARARQRRRVLFIGSGGAISVRQFAEVYPGIAIDLVEIDPRVLDLASRWYALGAIPRLTLHVADGFTFMKHTPANRWDVVIVDAYDAADAPAAVSSRAFFDEVGRALTPGGAVAVNAIGPLRGDGPVQRIERIMRRALSEVRLVPVLDPDESFRPSDIRNVVILGSRG
jgi:spermidine synthase